jgi:monofunctional biosynthetic peptidoglycan transglycosylase
MPATSSAARLAVRTAGGILLAAASLAVGLWVTLPDPAPLARENPRTTALIEQRRAEARASHRAFRPTQTWVPAERISPVLVHAVLLSEDANFFGHEGFDWEALRDAAEHDFKVRRFARGASTLTQQLAKNLWLGTERSLWRKVKEAVLAAKLERALSKRRILTLYLNVVEMDDGVFGVEAGARHRFGAGAATLSPAQAAVLASLLPAPRRVDLDHPSAWLRTRARRLLDRMLEFGRLDAAAHRSASAELERILSGSAPGDDREEPPDDDARAPPPAVKGPAARRPSTDAPEADAPQAALASDDQNGGAGTAGQSAGAPKEQGGGATQE